MSKASGGMRVTAMFAVLLIVAMAVVLIPTHSDESEIAAIMPSEGDQSAYGHEYIRGIMMAESDLPADTKMHISYYDSSKESLDSIMDRIVERKTNIIIGPLSSGETEYITPRAYENNIIIVSPSATSDVLSKHINIFTLASSDAYRANGIVRVLNENKYDNMVAVYDSGDPYSVAMAECLVKSAETECPNIKVECISADTQDLVGRITALSPECVYVALTSSTDFLNIKEGCEAKGLDSIWFGDENILCDRFSSSPSSNGAYCFTFSRNITAKSFLDRYKEMYGTETRGELAAYGYDAVMICRSTLISAGNEYQDLWDGLSGLRSIELTGSVSFDKDGNRYPWFSIYECVNGSWVKLKWSDIVRMTDPESDDKQILS